MKIPKTILAVAAVSAVYLAVMLPQIIYYNVRYDMAKKDKFEMQCLYIVALAHGKISDEAAHYCSEFGFSVSRR